MTKEKRPLRGAALHAHLTKQIRDLDEFNAETERIQREVQQAKLVRNPLYCVTLYILKGAFVGAVVGLVAIAVRPNYITPAICLGAIAGLSSSALVRRE